LTGEWGGRRVNANKYGEITIEMSQTTFDVTPADHAVLKGLGENENLRSNMTGTELAISTLGERAAVDIMRARNTQGLKDTKEASIDGAKVARVAREALELQIGQKVVSKQRFLPSGGAPAAP
jgi:hypothetical protein